ncbi:hypothetical protein [Streptomyces sp. NPDC090026]|uniref:hypothetical protein n=1 Tax=Streptomyces sp. NPDC090026 TaxID=3365923 RepID=UPI0038135471
MITRLPAHHHTPEHLMTTTHTHPTTTQHLWTIARHWTDLHNALADHTPTWPPTMGIATHSARTQSTEDAEAAAWRAQALRALERSPDQPGWTAAPIRLDVLDALVLIEGGIIELADTIAAAVQHSPVAPSPPRRTWPADPRAYRAARADAARRDALALRQSADPRRWRFTGPTRTVPRAALWLLAQAQGVRGPWRPLDDQQLQRVRAVAGTAARLLERCLDVGDGRVRLDAGCPSCGGLVDLHGGGGARPVAHCTNCGHTWTQRDTEG